MLNKLLRNEKDNWSPKTIWSFNRATKSYKNHVCKYLSELILVRSTLSLNVRRDKNILMAYLISKDLFLYLYEFLIDQMTNLEIDIKTSSTYLVPEENDSKSKNLNIFSDRQTMCGSQLDLKRYKTTLLMIDENWHSKIKWGTVSIWPRK